MKSYKEACKRSEILNMQQRYMSKNPSTPGGYLSRRLDLNYTRENISYEQKNILQKKNPK
jgi:hypothetical protein